MSSTKGRHAAPMTAIRLIQDRAQKFYNTGPADWLKRKHRQASHAEVIRAMLHHHNYRP